MRKTRKENNKVNRENRWKRKNKACTTWHHFKSKDKERFWDLAKRVFGMTPRRSFCVVCYTKLRGKQRLYCSPRCGYTNSNARNRARRLAERST